MSSIKRLNTTAYQAFMILAWLGIAAVAAPTAAEETVAERPVVRSLAQFAPESPEYQALGPMHRELADLLRTEQLQLATLGEQFKQATNSLESLKIQRQISKAKAQTELSLLGVQLRYARVAGETEVVKELEAAIESMQRPHHEIPSIAREQ